jgi:hypothetical protein
MFAPEMCPLRRAARIFAASLALALLIAPAAARAEDADALIKQGVDLRRAGKDQAALEQFRRAYDLGPTPRALAQMGLAEQGLGRWVDAEAHLGKALEAAQDPWIAKYHETLEASRAEIARHLGSLSVTGGPNGGELRIDGQPVGALPLRRTLRLPTGTYALELSAGGHVVASRTVSIASGLTTQEDLSPPSTPAAVTRSVSDSNQTPPPAGGRRKWAWITAGTAVGLGAAGGVGLLIGENEVEKFNGSNCRGMTIDPVCHGYYARGTLARWIGGGSLIAAGAVGVTAAILFLTAREGGAGADQRVACFPDLGRPGAACAFRF